MATKFKIVDILYPLFVEDPSVFLSVPPPTPNGSVLPIMLPSSNNSSRIYNNHGSHGNFGSFNMQSWDKQQSYLPSITNQQDQSKAILVFVFFMYFETHFFYLVIIRSQQQQSNNNLQSGSASPVPGNILPTNADENDMYLLNNPYEYRNSNNNRYPSSTTSNNYHIYSNTDNPSNGTAGSNSFSSYDHGNSPYIQQRKSHQPSVIDHVDTKNEQEAHNRRGSIDFPTSPPPEASSTAGLTKYSSYSLSGTSSSWSDSHRSLTQDIDTTITANTSSRKASQLGIYTYNYIALKKRLLYD